MDKKNEPVKENGISLKRIFIFLIIAVPLSNIFRFNVFENRNILAELPIWINLSSLIILEGTGVFIGALVAIYLLKKERKVEISLFGTSKSKSILMAVIPIIILPLIGVKNEYGVNEHYYGLIITLGTLLYCIMEELGWRGYLQEELKSLKPIKRYVLIGVIWYFWHLTFLTGATLWGNLFFLGIMVVGSWGIGQVAESTKSVMASACFHLIVQIMIANTLIRDGINGTQKLIILGISVVIWVIILKKWEKNNLRLLNEKQNPNN